jgi:hypothetical protein
MKPLLLFITFLVFTASPVFSQDAEEKAVKEALEGAGTASGTQSWSEVSKNFWILDNNTIVYSSFMDGKFIELRADQMQASGDLPADSPAIVSQSNHQIAVNGNMASATFDQLRTGANGEKVYSHEMALLEKIGGAWKIHLATIHRYLP